MMVGMYLDKHVLKSLNAIEIDSEKIDIDLIHRNLETNTNAVLTLYNYLLEKGIIKVA